MSTEEYTCCDAPGCGTAERLGHMDLERWVDLTVTTCDAEGMADKREGHACAPECVGPAAVALYLGVEGDDD